MGTELIFVIAALGAVDGDLAVIDLIAADVGQNRCDLDVVCLTCFENDMAAAAAFVVSAVALINIFTRYAVIAVAVDRITALGADCTILSGRLSGLGIVDRLVFEIMLLGIGKTAAAMGAKRLVRRVILVVHIFSGVFDVVAGVRVDRNDRIIRARGAGEVALAFHGHGIVAGEL